VIVVSTNLAIFAWLVVWNILFFHILGMSSSQLTFMFFRGVGQPPSSWIRDPGSKPGLELRRVGFSRGEAELPCASEQRFHPEECGSKIKYGLVMTNKAMV